VTAILAMPDDDRTRPVVREWTAAQRRAMLARIGIEVPSDEPVEEFRRRLGLQSGARDLVLWFAAPAEDEPEPERTEPDFEEYRRELVLRQRGTPSACTDLVVWTPPRKSLLARVAGRLYFALRLNRVGQPLDPKPFAVFTAWTVLVVLGLNLFLGGRG
jgi:hypothetical protein